MRGEAFNKVVEQGPEIDDEGVRLGAWLGVRLAEGIVADGLAVPAFPACLQDRPPDCLVCPEALKALHTTELTLFSDGKPMIRRVEGDSSRCLSFGLFHGLCLGGTFLCSLQRVHFAVFLFPLFLPLPLLLLLFPLLFLFPLPLLLGCSSSSSSSSEDGTTEFDLICFFFLPPWAVMLPPNLCSNGFLYFLVAGLDSPRLIVF